MKKTAKLLAGVIGAAALVLALSGTAQAHSRFFFGLTIAPPLPPPVYVYPSYPRVYVEPAPPPYYYDRGIYYERNYDPYSGRYYYAPRYEGPYHRGHRRDWDDYDY